MKIACCDLATDPFSVPNNSSGCVFVLMIRIYGKRLLSNLSLTGTVVAVEICCVAIISKKVFVFSALGVQLSVCGKEQSKLLFHDTVF